MRKIIYTLSAFALLAACKSVPTVADAEQPISVVLDLVNVENDRVQVTINPGRFTAENTTFFIPKTVPGTYSEDNYGKLIEDFKAFTYAGKDLPVTGVNENSWSIANAEELDYVTYWVNDTYDIEGEEGVFSPSGTNIEAGENFMLNLHGFVGYFEGLKEKAYKMEIKHPNSLIAGSSLTPLPDTNEPTGIANTDVFLADRYFGIIDNPIMYAKPDTTSFVVDGMEVLINVHSPNDVYSAESIKPGIVEMVTAQKNFLGDIDNTDKYAILLYLSDQSSMDARGFGALEHHTSTVVVLPEAMPMEGLQQTMTDVVSHEFFHILTPLSVHSNEIHYFDYNNPRMSKHLWMYEGVTEYFANLFQVNQGLIPAEDFYARMADKIQSSKNFDDTVPFTLLSENILKDEYKDSYYNVYLKGALIGMALDIRLRELSNGQTGILDLMKALSGKYGKEKPFEDDQLVNDIVALTYPEIQSFFATYVTGTTPIPYEEFFAKVGLDMKMADVNTGYLMNKNVPYIDANPDTGNLFFREGIQFNSFLKELGVEGGDVIKSINGTEYNMAAIYALLGMTENWQEGQEVSLVVERDGEEITLEAVTFQPTDQEIRIAEMELAEGNPKLQLREAWLKN